MLEVLQDDHEFDLAGSARIDVLVSTIKPRQASQIVKELSELLPLDQAKLTHLKRIRSSQHPEGGRLLQVILSPPDIYHSLEEAKRREIEERFSLNPTLHAVPKLEPRTRAQFESGGSVWPIIFHHSTSEEARRAAREIPEQEALDAVAFMREALKDAEAGRQQNGGRATVGAVLVDPAVGRGVIAATASRERQWVHDECPASMRNHPLHHAAILCVQGVGRALAARGQGGDGTGDGEASEGKSPPQGEGRHGTEGSKEVEVPSPHQYLCTGFDLYITREPCLMCAMALVHSRVRRVIFGVRDKERGCLGSVMMLHTLAPLNHKYRVFEGVCTDECLQSLADKVTKPPAT